ncbi:MAG: hypothetical protein B5766_10300 [Candidatus Lumbricidophila eiseniae]|uniref:Uncharacterized protein n=1 Tax=Candidatus Lumbricidiphila eiseniae TaxID=1969409 RepID=A0A2A6FNV9_9MICO|nr:MAG: hypothetical protein B5766_10300 [Candidatus Lumbricidophila eiseniae]
MTLTTPSLETRISLLQDQIDALRAEIHHSEQAPARAQLRLRLTTLLESPSADKLHALGAINLARGEGHLGRPNNNDVPENMSFVIGMFLREIDTYLPTAMCSSSQWRPLIPLAIETNRDRDLHRLDTLLEWFWGTAVPRFALLDLGGSGDAWFKASTLRTRPAMRAACRVIYSHSTAMYSFDYALELSRRAHKCTYLGVIAHHSAYSTSALLGGVAAIMETAHRHGVQFEWDDLHPVHLYQQMLTA